MTTEMTSGEVKTNHPHQKHLDELDAVRAWIEANPDVPIESCRAYLGVARYSVPENEVAAIRAEHAATARALARTGTVEKFADGTDNYPTAGLRVQVTENTKYKWEVPRDAVCTKTTVVKEVEEWSCEPVLAAATTQEATSD